MYEFTALREDFSVKKIVTVHYFECNVHYEYTEEVHDFYELVYVDKGETEIYDGENLRRLSHGECIIHMPGVRHRMKCAEKSAPNLIIIKFDCKSPHMKFADGKIFNLSAADREHIAVIVREAAAAFDTPLNDPYSEKLKRNKNVIGSEQLIKISLESVIISLYRGNGADKPESLLKEHIENDIAESVKEYLAGNVHKKIKFSDVVSFANACPTSVKSAFKKCVGTGVMTYFANLKIERAKQYIREDNYNFTQISQLLGYDTLHRFSKQFKAKTGMTPTEYANSVKISMERSDCATLENSFANRGE